MLRLCWNHFVVHMCLTSLVVTTLIGNNKVTATEGMLPNVDISIYIFQWMSYGTLLQITNLDPGSRLQGYVNHPKMTLDEAIAHVTHKTVESIMERYMTKFGRPTIIPCPLLK